MVWIESKDGSTEPKWLQEKKNVAADDDDDDESCFLEKHSNDSCLGPILDVKLAFRSDTPDDRATAAAISVHGRP